MDRISDQTNLDSRTERKFRAGVLKKNTEAKQSSHADLPAQKTPDKHPVPVILHAVTKPVIVKPQHAPSLGWTRSRF